MLVTISGFTRNVFSLEFAAMQYEVLNLGGRQESPYGMFHS